MKKFRVLPVLIIFSIISFSLAGCFKDDSDKADNVAKVPKVEEVTVEDIKNGFDAPTGNGIAPDNKEDAVALFYEIDDASGAVIDVLDTVFENEISKGSKSLSLRLSSIKKRLKSDRVLKSAKKVSSVLKTTNPEPDTETINYKWDEPIDIDLSQYPSLFTAGTIKGNFSGSDILTYIVEMLSETQIKATNDENYKDQLSLEYTNIKPAGKDFTINGFDNTNSNDISYTYAIVDYIDSNIYMQEMYIDSSFAISNSSGFTISGETYSCYILTDIDLFIANKFKYIESVHGEMSDEEFLKEYMKNLIINGSLSVKIYDKEGNLIYSVTLDSEEIRDMFFNVDFDTEL